VFEARMARLLAARGLPPAVPEYEVWNGATFVARVDFAYPELLLAIEVDGFAAHSSVDAFRCDRARQNALVTAGWTVLRFTWTEVDDNSPRVGSTIRDARRLAA
jgi:very-short-patch-repair endonuclease